jgi:hypothetical protein
MPNTTYRVSLTISSNSNFGTGSNALAYMQVSTKTTNSFVITLRNSKGDTEIAPSGATVDWVVLSDSN